MRSGSQSIDEGGQSLGASGVFRGNGATAPWSDCDFLDNFHTVFVSFVLRLYRKMRVPRLLVTVRVFCRLKTASKRAQGYHFGDIFYEYEPTPSATPHPLNAYGASPLLTKILNTPLPVAPKMLGAPSICSLPGNVFVGTLYTKILKLVSSVSI